MSSFKILTVNDPVKSYARPVEHLGLEVVTEPELFFRNPQEFAMVIFTGGADVTPALYGHQMAKETMNNFQRDVREVTVFQVAKAYNIPLLGICRGSQFLCAMAGGKVVQDISGHAGQSHKLRVMGEGETYVSPEPVTSTHHQMQYPFNLPKEDYELLAWADSPRSTHYNFADKVYNADEASGEMRLEPDVVFYKKINGLAIQYHPEYMEKSTWGFRFAQELVNKYLTKHAEHV